MTADLRHLPPVRGRAQLEVLLADGTITSAENRFVDLKRELDGNNKSTAKDLAAMALDGGVIIYGLDEQDPASVPPALHPIELDSTIERLSNIAATAVSPPVRPVYERVETGRGKGVLFVRVPASPVAPHQADKRYWRRSDHGNQPMDDAEVRRHLDVRRAVEQDIEDRLAEFVADDPFPNGSQGHLHLLAVPALPDATRLLRAIDGPGNWHSLLQDVERASNNWFTGLRYTRAGGAAITSFPGAGRIPSEPDRESGSRDLEIGEDGSVRLYDADAVEIIRPNGASGDTDRQASELVVGEMLKLLLRTVRMVAERSAYYQTWWVGVHIGGLRGARSLVEDRRRSQLSVRKTEVPRYSRDEYRHVAQLTHRDLDQAEPREAVDLLVGAFFRGLHGAAGWDIFKQAFSSAAGTL